MPAPEGGDPSVRHVLHHHPTDDEPEHMQYSRVSRSIATRAGTRHLREIPPRSLGGGCCTRSPNPPLAPPPPPPMYLWPGGGGGRTALQNGGGRQRRSGWAWGGGGTALELSTSSLVGVQPSQAEWESRQCCALPFCPQSPPKPCRLGRLLPWGATFGNGRPNRSVVAGGPGGWGSRVPQHVNFQMTATSH